MEDRQPQAEPLLHAASAPGTHSFDTRVMVGVLDLNVEAGREYYLRLDVGDCEDPPDCSVSSSPSVVAVAPEKGRAEVRTARPVEPGDVKERALVIIPPAR